MIKYYQTFDTKEHVKYSLDMVRLNIDFGTRVQHFTNYMSHIATNDLRYEVTYYPSFKQFSYRHLWSIKDTLTDDTWSVGLDLGNTSESAQQGFIEFNPNKCMNSPLFVEFWEFVKMNSPLRELVRYDMAIDIPTPRSQCKLFRQGKRMYQYIQKDDGITEYLGQRSHGGFVKLYDKTIESKLDYALTRLEITLDKRTNVEECFPVVHLVEPQISLLMADELTPTNQALVTMLRYSEDRAFYLATLDRRTRKKIEPYLADKVLSLDKLCAHSVYTLALSFEK